MHVLLAPLHQEDGPRPRRGVMRMIVFLYNYPPPLSRLGCVSRFFHELAPVAVHIVRIANATSRVKGYHRYCLLQSEYSLPQAAVIQFFVVDQTGPTEYGWGRGCCRGWGC